MRHVVSIAHFDWGRQKGKQQKVLSVGEGKVLLVKAACSQHGSPQLG